MASINWQITLVAFLPILVAFAVGRAAWSRMLLYRKLEGEAGDRVTGFLARDVRRGAGAEGRGLGAPS